MAVVFLLLCFSVFVYLSIFSLYGNSLKKVRIGNVEFEAESVSKREKISLGLGGRKKLCENCAMLFLFPIEGNRYFYMKNMNFDLDVIWIQKSKIVKISKNVSKNYPDSISPDMLSDKVLEINAGLADKYGFQEGDSVVID